MLSSPINSYIPDVIVSISTPKEMHFLLTKNKNYDIIYMCIGKVQNMQKYVPVQWFLDTNCNLRRYTPCYSEEFSIRHVDVPAIYAVPAEEVRNILNALISLGGHEELIEYIKFLLKEE